MTPAGQRLETVPPHVSTIGAAARLGLSLRRVQHRPALCSAPEGRKMPTVRWFRPYGATSSSRCRFPTARAVG